MKIDGHHGGADCVTARIDAAGTGRPRTKADAGQAGGDRLELSAGVEILKTALQAATDAPEIRQDAVERVRQKLLAGELGQDPLRLADRMLDQIIVPR